MKSTYKFLAATAALTVAMAAQAVPVALTELTGLTGGSLAGTAVYKADLSTIGLASILSIGIRDNSSMLGGAGGQFSGFDLDAIKLSTTDCADAACAAAAVGLAVFDFTSGTIFSAGSQRRPTPSSSVRTAPAMPSTMVSRHWACSTPSPRPSRQTDSSVWGTTARSTST